MGRNLSIIRLLILLIIDLILVYEIRESAIADGNDKNIFLFWFYYPLLIIANFIIWLIFRSREYRYNKFVIVIICFLVALFFPILYTL